MSLNVALRHRFPDAALDIAFEAPTPGVTILFGPSGAGKSTVIAAIAGLLRPDHGQIEIGGVTLSDTERRIWVPPEQRHVGVVFQDARLFPHMSVLNNLRYGQRRTAPGPIRLDDVVALLGIENLLHRRPGKLSGGERSRVAIGRALLAQPLLLLMDEPLASLDAPRRAEILPFLARLRTEIRLPILYVTHAFDEAARLGDTLVLLDQGRVQAAGPLQTIAARADLSIGDRDDAGAILFGHVAAHDPSRKLTEIKAAGRTIWVPLLDIPPGTAVRLRVPARDVIVATEIPQGISLHNVLPATVAALAHDDSRHAVFVALSLLGASLLARVTPDAVERLGLQEGTPVLALFKSMSVIVLG